MAILHCTGTNATPGCDFVFLHSKDAFGRYPLCTNNKSISLSREQFLDLAGFCGDVLENNIEETLRDCVVQVMAPLETPQGLIYSRLHFQKTKGYPSILVSFLLYGAVPATIYMGINLDFEAAQDIINFAAQLAAQA